MSEEKDTKKTKNEEIRDKNINAESLRDSEDTTNPMLESQSIPSESQSISQNTEIRDFCVSRLLSGLTYVQLESELKDYNIQISKSQLQRLLPRPYVESIREQLKLEQQQTQTPIKYQIPNRNVPSQHLIIPQSWLSKYKETLPKAQRVTFQQMIENVTTYNQNLEREAQQRLQSGQPYTSGNPSQDVTQAQARYRNAMAEAIELRNYERITGSPRGNDGVESMLKLIKLGVDLVPKGKNVSDLDVYRSGRQDQKTDLTKSGNSNLVDLKIEELRQSHDIGMAKISWEQKLALLKMEADQNKWERIENTFAPILQQASPEIKNMIRKIGEQVGKSMGSLGANPNVQTEKTSVECPKCKSPLNVRIPEGLARIQVKCPKCQDLFKLGKSESEEATQTELRPKTRLTYKDS